MTESFVQNANPQAVLALAPAASAPRWWTAPSLNLLTRLARRLTHGSLTLQDPQERTHRFGGAEPGPAADIRLRKPRAARRLLTGGEMGFAEAYIDGDWDSADPVALIRLALRNEAVLQSRLRGNALLRAANRLRHLSRANTRRGSARNIAYHYDLGNAFYAAWLDAGMSYSSAIFTGHDESLEDAQRAKMARIAELADLRGGEDVLEIGIGWGGLAETLVRQHRCRLTGVTLSREQLAFARARLADDVHAGRADLRLLDYRDTQGSFDRVVSIEMLEAVGRENWPVYFDVLQRRLRPGGRAVLQVITIAEDRYESYRRGADFIQRYIFPGGFLPTAAHIREHGARAGLTLRDEVTFGASYARTLAEWRTRFHAAWPTLERMGFDQRFRRMWDFYLAYCEGGFRENTIDVGLYVFERPR
jgi:cyclopropane-fatty-acyl-phospholipid synthase